MKAWVLGVCLAIGLSAARAEPPKVALTVPANGATNVDPGLRELRVAFDQDMEQGSASWVGVGPSFPKVEGEPRWADARTCLLPVRLEPNHAYSLGINSAQHRNFRSAAGEPAVPHPLQFRTGPGPAAAPAGAHRAAAAALRKAIDEKYSYRDLRGVDWAKLFAVHGPRMEQAASAEAFAREAAALLAHAQDAHVTLRVGGKPVGTFVRDVPPNYDVRAVARLVPNWTQESRAVATGLFEDGTAYLLIGTWDQDRREQVEPAFKALETFRDAKRLLVDVRPNNGGSEYLAAEFAGCFVDAPVAYAQHATRDASLPGGFAEPRKRVLEPSAKRPRFRGRVAVLMGQVNMSSSEGFLLMMKQVPGCRLVGEPSYGASGNPLPTDLGNGVAVFLPSWKAMGMDGVCFEGKGIAPDVLVKAGADELRDRDPVLEAALKAVRE